MTRRLHYAILPVIAGLFAAQDARACLPPLPPPAAAPGESAEAFKQRMAEKADAEAKAVAAWELQAQTRAWDAAGTVMLVRQVGLATEGGQIDKPLAPGAFVVVTTYQPLAGLKGKLAKHDMTLRFVTAYGCGATGRATGTTGKAYLLYFRPGEPGDETVIDWVAVDRVSEPRARAAIAAAGDR